jgi:multidrug resistance efflux pump
MKAKRVKRKKFHADRRLLVNEASLNAKKDFIEFIRTDMSAEDIIVQPETPFDTKFDNLVTETQEKVEEAYPASLPAPAKVHEATAAKLEDVSYEILAKEGIMAAIKKVNPDLDMAAVEAKIAKKNADLAAELKSARESLAQTQSNLDNIKAELKRIKGSLLKENISVVETLSQMNVVGLFPIANFESWDGN